MITTKDENDPSKSLADTEGETTNTPIKKENNHLID